LWQPSMGNALRMWSTAIILGTYTRSLQLRCHGNLHALDGNRWLPHRCI